jgi:cytochrome c oxidase assembly factor CtaG
VRNRFTRLRRWLPLVGAALVVGVLVPPWETLAREYVFAQAVQFAVLAVAAPALIVLGAPWRLRLQWGRDSAGRTGAGAGPADGTRPPGQRLAERIATARSHRPGTARAWLTMIVFIAVALTWRLPVTVDAVVRHPALVIAEAVTLLAAGCALWLELVDSPPLLPRASKPQRAASAALPMWSIWASAYVMAFSHAAWFAALAHAPGHGLSTVADQQIAAFLLWAIPGLCFVPVVYFSLITWLRDSSDPAQELRDEPGAEDDTGPRMPRPPRGWRLPSA